MPQKKVLAIACSALLVPMFFARGAAATQPVQDIGVIPPSQPPPQGQGQPPQYQQPPPQYPQYQQVPTYPQYQQQQQYPQYQQMPPAYPAPRPRAWRDGDPVPAGYHVEEKPRSGLVTAGLVTLLIPYSITAFAGIAAKFGNESTWLLAPVIGPWMTMGQRNYYSCSKSNTSDSLGCAADVFVVMGLVISGIAQAAGGSLLLIGSLATKPTLVRDDTALHVRPMTVGSGYGVGVLSAF